MSIIVISIAVMVVGAACATMSAIYWLVIKRQNGDEHR